MPPKKKIQDILPSKRRSIREVTLDDGSSQKTSPHAEKKIVDRGIRVPIHLDHTVEMKRADPPSTLTKKSPSKKKNKSSRKWLVGGVALVCCIVIIYVASIFLARASVNITPRSQSVPVNGTYIATRNAQSPNLSFETVSTTTTAHISVAVSAGIVNTYATGMARLINAGSPSSQQILAGTRLADNRGLIYRTVSTVILPAATSKSAGTVAVKIIASVPGPGSNLSLSSLKGDLSIVVWQGTAKAKIFYGRMTTDMTGGSSSPSMTVAPTTLSNAESTLSSRLSTLAQNAIQNTISSEYILYPSASKTIFSSTTVVSTGSTTADVSMSATITGIYFNKSDLENLLAKSQIAQFPADTYEVNGLDSLVFAPFSGQKLSFATSSIKFTLTGALNIVGLIDTSTIKNQLLGKPLSASNSVFSQYSSVISGAQVSIVPFWIRTIPSSPNRISVILSTGTNHIQ